MKYIRTSNGRIMKMYSKQQRQNGEYDTWYKGNGASLLYNHDHNTIEKEADTIEELCDELVGVENGISQFPVVMPNNKVARDYLLENFNFIYGAIWTDKGLIYVAKMNEKGELELL